MISMNVGWHTQNDRDVISSMRFIRRSSCFLSRTFSRLSMRIFTPDDENSLTGSSSQISQMFVCSRSLYKPCGILLLLLGRRCVREDRSTLEAATKRKRAPSQMTTMRNEHQRHPTARLGIMASENHQPQCKSVQTKKA
jgi:hypothetical protein